MVEDALTATRTLHRLLLAASAVALVFVFSLADVRQDRHLLEDIRRLRTLPLAEYPIFVKEKAAATVLPRIERSAQQFAQQFHLQISSAGLRVLATEQIPEAFRKPIHIGSLDLEKSVLDDPDAATLNRLDRMFSDLPVDRNVQIVHAAPLDRIQDIVTFLADGTAGGSLGPAVASVGDVQVGLTDDPGGIADSFISSNTEPELRLYFVLNRENQTDPVYEGSFRGHVEILPDTSWRAWLEREGNAADLYSKVNGRLRWLGQYNLPLTLRNKPLRALEDELAKKVEDATARNRTIDLPGISVPGPLALFAIPIALLGLASSLAQNLSHLQRLAPKHPEKFAEFAWTPLTLGSSWRRDILLTAVFLPALAQVLLAWRYDAFGLPPSLVVLTGVAGAMGSILYGRKLVQQLASLRKAIGKNSGTAPFRLAGE